MSVRIVWVSSAATGANSGATKQDAYTSIKSAHTNMQANDEVRINVLHSETISTSFSNYFSPLSGAEASIISWDFVADCHVPSAQDNITVGDGATSCSYSFTGVDRIAGLRYRITNNATFYPPSGIMTDDVVVQHDGTGGSQGEVMIGRPISSRRTSFSNTKQQGITIVPTLLSSEHYDSRLSFMASSTGVISLTYSPYSIAFVGGDWSQCTGSPSRLLVQPLSYLLGASVFSCRIQGVRLPSGWAELPANDFRTPFQSVTLAGSHDTKRYFSRFMSAMGEVVTDDVVTLSGGFKESITDTPVSHKMTALSRCCAAYPLYGFPLKTRIPTAGTRLIEVECLDSSIGIMTTADAHLEVFCSASSATPGGKLVRAAEAVVAMLQPSTAQWDNAPGGSRPIKMSAVIDFPFPGVFYVRPVLTSGNPGQTLRVDPVVRFAY